MIRDATPVIGAVIAGGSSTRFGSPKALAEVAGTRVVDRVRAALADAVAPDGRVVAIVNDAALAERIGLPHRPDIMADAGALAGVHAALRWAIEDGARGVLACGCDMPFVEADLLRLLASHDTADVVLPESTGRRGVEPLCAFYGITCIAPIEAAIRAGDARMIGFHDAVDVRRIPLAQVREFGDPAVMFMNINSESDREMAERTARRPA